MFERRTIKNPWEGRIEPFKVVGNVYFCGTFQASCHLIDTKDICSDQCLHWSQELSTGQFHVTGFKSTGEQKEKPHRMVWFLYAKERLKVV